MWPVFIWLLNYKYFLHHQRVILKEKEYATETIYGPQNPQELLSGPLQKSLPIPGLDSKTIYQVLI